MATLEEIYRKALTDEGERAALAQAAADPQALAEFLAQRGCDAAPEEACAFAQERLARTGELSGEELLAVSGGALCGEEKCKCEYCGAVDAYYTGKDYQYTCRTCGKTFVKNPFIEVRPI